LDVVLDRIIILLIFLGGCYNLLIFLLTLLYHHMPNH